MNTERKKIILKIGLYVFLMFFVIVGNNLLEKNTINSDISYTPSSTAIIGGADGPTAIYIIGNYNWKITLRYSLIVICLLDLLVLITVEIIQFVKIKRNGIKYVLKIIFAIDLYVIIIGIMYFGISIFGALWITISIMLNFVLGTIFFIKDILIKIIKLP